MGEVSYGKGDEGAYIWIEGDPRLWMARSVYLPYTRLIDLGSVLFDQI